MLSNFSLPIFSWILSIRLSALCCTQTALTNVVNDLHDSKSNRILSLHLAWPPSFWLSKPKSLESFLTSLYMSHINLPVFISFTVTFTYIWKPTISHYLYFLHSGLTYIIYCLDYCSSLSANLFASHVPPQSTLNTAPRVRLWNSMSDHVIPLLRTLQWFLTPLSKILKIPSNMPLSPFWEAQHVLTLYDLLWLCPF